MMTAWGLGTKVVNLEEGISFMQAGDQGGLVLNRDYAEKNLSYPARKRGRVFDSFVTYGMDSAWAIPFWELRRLWPRLRELGWIGRDADVEHSLCVLLTVHFPAYLHEYRALKSYALCRP
jgi:hypothetical protein